MKKKQQPGRTMLFQKRPAPSICPKCGEFCTTCGKISLEHKFSLTFGHVPELYARTTTTNGDQDATAETPTAATATPAPGADENNDDPDDEQ